MKDNKKQKTEEVSNANGGVFSAQLETLISSTLQNGMLTKQEIVMILNDRLAVMQQEFGCNNYSLPPSLKPDVRRVLIIPEGVIKIEQGDFEISNKEEIAFPSSIKEIGTCAFGESENLKLLDFSKCTQLEIIGDSAFQWCRKLETVILPSSLKVIANYAFMGCDSLKEVDFSRCDKLEQIGYSAFNDCEKIEEADFSHCVSLNWCSYGALCDCDNICKVDFSGCENLDLDVLDIPQDNLKKLVLPSGQETFNKMFLWDSVDTSHCKNVKEVENGAFSEMDIKEIEIPDTVEVIGVGDSVDGPFERCQNLKSIVMPAALKEINVCLGYHMNQLKKIDFSKVKNLRVIPKKFLGSGCKKLKELIIPYGVKEIEDDAFSELNALLRLFLPPTLESIGDLGLTDLSLYCFSPSLEEIEPIVYGWDDKHNKGSNSTHIDLYVLPQYLGKYIAQRSAERIPEEVLTILQIPEEYLYFYDNQ